MDAPALRLTEVTKVFDGAARPAVDRISMSVDAGEPYVVDPSGCGKTTTLRMINRLVEPTSGRIDVFGEPNDALPAHELRRRIGYVIQQVGLFPHRTIEGNISTVPELLGWDRARIRERVRELVDLVGLDPELLRRYPPQLSGGQQQRVGVARALAADPPLLLMDEPYSAVDPLVRERLQDELLALQQRLGTTIVVVTHDLDEAIKLGRHVAVFGAGGVLEQYATPDEAKPAGQPVRRGLPRSRETAAPPRAVDRRARRRLRFGSGLAPAPAPAPTIRSAARLVVRRDQDVLELEADAPARAALDPLLRTPGAMICVRRRRRPSAVRHPRRLPGRPAMRPMRSGPDSFIW
ncbi:MAG: ABC transporter ATP-binding protein [Ilumatobacteraceae bacterium]